MKKISLLFLSVALIVGASSCKKKKVEEPNTTAPTLTLNGSSSLTLGVGDTYTELGATATDVKGTSLTVAIDASNVNTALTGVYDVLYSATDADGNSAQTKRKVNVAISDQNWVGLWSVSHNFSVCTPAGSVLGDKVEITIFGGSITLQHSGSGSAQNFTGTINGQNITLTQTTITINPISPLKCIYDVTGSGTISNDGKTITMTYSRTGTSTGAGNGTSQATYTKSII